MQTIKTIRDEFGFPIVITKVINEKRKVSCSCCETVEPTCCMYPADELGWLYTDADLPSQLRINWTGELTGTINKSGSTYTSGTVTLKRNNTLTSWILENTDTDPPKIQPVGSCLIRGDGNLTQNNDLVEDLFEDTYTVFDPSLVFPQLGRDGTQLSNRISLCEWAGVGYEDVEESVRGILYNGGNGNEYPFPDLPLDTWLILIPDGTQRVKTGPDQSSPVGSYDGGITVYT